jgi:ribosomal protein L19E
MKPSEIETLYMTPDEAAEYLGVTKSRVRKLISSGQITKMKGSIYSRAEIEAYKLKRGDKKGGPYPKQ